MKDQVTTKTEGLQDLKNKEKDGILRPGQLILGETPSKDALDASGVFGWFCDVFPRMVTKLSTNQAPCFAYFHVAVYVGCYDDAHFVV